MKKLFKYTLTLFLFSMYVQAASIEYCNSQCNIKIDEFGGETSDLNCTLSKIKTLKINAKNVFNAEGNLKTYWDGKTACDVLGWMNTAVDHIHPNYNGLKTAFTQTMDLEFKSLQRNIGGVTGKAAISFDSDRPYLLDGTNDGSSNFHWLRMHFIVVHEFSHFIEKNSQAKTHSGIPAWVEEGRAKDFEDIVYDSQNPYRDVSTSYKMYEQGIANVLNSGGLTKYDYPNFVFFKALRNKCGHIEMGLLTNNQPNLKQATDGCTDIPNVGGDELAGLFTLYNWAMLYKQDLSLLDSNEPVRPNNEIFVGEYKKIDEKGFTEPIDITSKIGTTLAPFSAKSFLITHETLKGEGDVNLTFKSSGDLKLIAVRVKEDGSSDVNDNFVMDLSTQSYNLTEEDRAGGLFVTLVNTTGVEVMVDEINLTKKALGVVIDKDAGLMWQDNGKYYRFPQSSVANYCAGMSLAGYSDWRAPRIEELENMYKTGVVNKFVHKLRYKRWSITYSHTSSGFGGTAWYFTFDFLQGVRSTSKYRNEEIVMCVRDL